MKHVFNAITKDGAVIPVYLHENAGFVWALPNGKRVNLAIPTTMKTVEARLTFQIGRTYPGVELEKIAE